MLEVREGVLRWPRPDEPLHLGRADASRKVTATRILPGSLLGPIIGAEEALDVAIEPDGDATRLAFFGPLEWVGQTLVLVPFPYVQEAFHRIVLGAEAGRAVVRWNDAVAPTRAWFDGWRLAIVSDFDETFAALAQLAPKEGDRSFATKERIRRHGQDDETIASQLQLALLQAFGGPGSLTGLRQAGERLPWEGQPLLRLVARILEANLDRLDPRHRDKLEAPPVIEQIPAPDWGEVQELVRRLTPEQLASRPEHLGELRRGIEVAATVIERSEGGWVFGPEVPIELLMAYAIPGALVWRFELKCRKLRYRDWSLIVRAEPTMSVVTAPLQPPDQGHGSQRVLTGSAAHENRKILTASFDRVPGAPGQVTGWVFGLVRSPAAVIDDVGPEIEARLAGPGDLPPPSGDTWVGRPILDLDL